MVRSDEPQHLRDVDLDAVAAAGKASLITFPDVCSTPAPPASPVPIPYPNLTLCSDKTTNLKK